MKLEITKEHLESGKNFYIDGLKCPIGLALKEKFPERLVRAYSAYVEVGDKRFDIFNIPENFAFNLPLGKVKPFVLEIDGL